MVPASSSEIPTNEPTLTVESGDTSSNGNVESNTIDVTNNNGLSMIDGDTSSTSTEPLTTTTAMETTSTPETTTSATVTTTPDSTTNTNTETTQPRDCQDFSWTECDITKKSTECGRAQQCSTDFRCETFVLNIALCQPNTTNGLNA